MAWCDPCAASPMSSKELAELGARWIGGDDAAAFRGNFSGGATVYVTRLYVRYDANTFPGDIVLLETRDRGNFQGRYILHHPWKGDAACQAAMAYRQLLSIRFAGEAKNLSELTGWEPRSIAARMAQTGESLSAK